MRADTGVEIGADPFEPVAQHTVNRFFFLVHGCKLHLVDALPRGHPRRPDDGAAGDRFDNQIGNLVEGSAKIFLFRLGPST